MQSFILFAHPWWVNTLVLIPILALVFWRRNPLALTAGQLAAAACFAAGFGFVEAAVVVYLRGAAGLLPGMDGTLADVARMSATLYEQPMSVAELPKSLLTIETAREAATMMMLVSVALLAAPLRRERWAMFLWTFAIWDLTYYAGLWATVGWPTSLKSADVLFLIPVPWLSQVWYPLLVSSLSVMAVLLGTERLSARIAVESRMPREVARSNFER